MVEEFLNPADLLETIRIKYMASAGFREIALGEIPTGTGACPFLRFKKKSAKGLPRILLSAGIHGDEPAGPHAILSLLRKVSTKEIILPEINLDIFPLINPSGFLQRTRTNQNGFDLNRCFATGHPPDEVRMMMDYLRNRSYDLSIEFHEDVDTKGFYLYEHHSLDRGSHDSPRWGHQITDLLRQKGYPINEASVIEGMPASNGVISPKGKRRTFFRRHGWPQAFYMHKHGTLRTLTLETPPCLPLEDRTNMLIEVFLFALRQIA